MMKFRGKMSVGRINGPKSDGRATGNFLETPGLKVAASKIRKSCCKEQGGAITELYRGGDWRRKTEFV